MDLSTFIIGVFDLCEDWLNDQQPIRSRGPAPKLSDSEVITMEIVGEFLGIDTEKGIYTYFKRHYPHYFPKIRDLHRTTFTRQAANLWVIKEILWQHLLEHELVLGAQEEEEEPLMVIDSFPIAGVQEEPLLPVQGDERALRERQRHQFGQVLRDEGSRAGAVARDNS
jgi:hypothetical protein